MMFKRLVVFIDFVQSIFDFSFSVFQRPCFHTPDLIEKNGICFSIRFFRYCLSFSVVAHS